MEEWRSFCEDARYKVSNLGRVRGPSGKILAGYRDKDGYHCVGIHRRGWYKAVKVHRAVALAFLDPPAPQHVVNHKNGIKDDNRAENLEWVTSKQNSVHSHRVLGRKGQNTSPARGTKHGNARFTDDMIREIRRRYDAGETQVALAKAFTTTQSQISRIIRRETWAHV
jgi:hypothetical protein